MSVVVGYSPSAPGRAAAEAGIEEAARRSLPLHVVFVARVGVRQETHAQMRSVQREIEEIAERARGAGIVAEAHEILSPQPPAEALLGHAREHGAAVLVIGVRRRSPVGKAVLGSTSQDVLLRAECPVLGVKASASEERWSGTS
jgi:nucleotide-binding universal stress UspA family protein